MKKSIYTAWFVFLVFGLHYISLAQSSSSAPYCYGAYSQTPCNQAGPSNSTGNFINDFIDDFSTTGANTNITNIASGCNSGTLTVSTTTTVVNYANFCSQYLATSPGQTIVCTMRSGITFGQGFALWVDWNQDNTFNVPAEYMGGTAGVPAPATNTTITFVVPSTQPNGTYRLRVRCVYATAGSGITPCTAYTFGETEDYTLFVGPIPPNSSTPTGTVTVNSPVCVGQALNFSLTTTYTSALSYSWTGPNSYSSNVQNPIIANASTTNNGVYTVLISNSICPIVRTVQATVVAYPSYTPSPLTHTICQGGSFVANINSFLSPSAYSCTWSTTAPGLIFNSIPTSGSPPSFSTNVIPSLLPLNVPLANYVYSVTISSTMHSCPIQQSMTLTINNPPTPTLTMPGPLCDTYNPVQLTAVPGGGTWSANVAVTPTGQFDPGLAISHLNTVTYSASIGFCGKSNSDTIWVSKFHTPALTSTISTRCVQDPMFNLMNIVQDTTTGFWSGPQVSNDMFTAAGLATGNYSLTYHTFSTPDPNVCPSSTVLVVSVFDPPVPVIATITPLCDNAATVALTANPPGGAWSGNPGVTVLGIRTPSLNLLGTNTVTYTAGQGTCVASVSQTFHMSRFNTAAFSGTIANLCENSAPINLMSIVQNTNGSWSGVNITNNFFSPSLLPTNTYSIVYSTTSTPQWNLCMDSKTIAVSVLNPVTPSITQVGPFCSKGGPVQLTVTPSTGHWVSSSYLTTNGMYTPSLTSVGNNNVQYIIGTATCNAQQTKIIKTEAFVSAALTSNVSDLCVTSPPLNLSPLPLNSTGYWAGQGVLASSFHPTVTGAGQFTLVYNTASIPSGLCPDQAPLTVNIFSLAPPVINTVGPFCNNALPIQLQVSPVGGMFGSGTSGIVTTSGLLNPAFGAIGDNFISYSIAVGPCMADSRINISIEKFVSADFENTGALAYCKNNVPFNLFSLVQNTGGRFSGSNGIIGESMFDPSLAPLGENTIIYETNSTPSTLLCPHTRSITILVKDIPNVTAKSNVESGGCAPLEVVFYTPNTNSGKGVWNISNGWEEEGLTFSHVFTSPGTYSVVFTYSDNDALACSTRVNLTTPIVVYDSPKADFAINPEEVTNANPEVILTNLSTVLTDNKYQWDITGKESNFEVNPAVTLDKIGTYKITLLATSIHNCTSEITKFVEVKNEFKIFIPNSFTPNFDGLNDVFIPVFSSYGLDSKSYEMEVFDRWGHSVFQSNEATKGWDGTFKNSGDDIMKKDSYIFKIRFKDLDGKVYYEQGAVTLIPN